MSPLAGTVALSVLTVLSGARNAAFADLALAAALDWVVEEESLDPPHPAIAIAAIATKSTDGLSKVLLLSR
jgi:hypothetical protein